MDPKILVWYSAPVYITIIAIEILLSNFQHRHFYSWKETVVNVYLNLLNSGIDLALRFLVGLPILYFFFRYTIPIHWNPIVYWVVLLFAEDLLFWLEHYVDHSSRLFWAVHVTHHSSPEYNLTTGFRSSVLMPVYKYLYFIPLMLVGFNPMDAIFMYSATQIYGILVHTQFIKKLPVWIEFIFVTPSHHRVHHASNTPYLDKNMGMVFIIWDRLFGTFTPESQDEAPVYGITTPLDKPFHPIQVITHEWKAIGEDLHKNIPFATKLKYIFNPPGWSHDGSRKTSKELQKEWQRKNASV